ncbi:DUF4440 domain-containing protein [bacterium]|nr:DUF4440 domain-containing protein [bacterium]
MKLAHYKWGIIAIMALVCGSCGKKEMDRGEKGSVREAYFLWVDAVEAAKGKTAGVLSLYANDAILLPTISPKLCRTKEELNEYFMHFLSLEDLKAETVELITREYGPIAMNTGFYTFTYLKDGEKQTVRARFDFWYKKVDGQWKIIFHQSSKIPGVK